MNLWLDAFLRILVWRKKKLFRLLFCTFWTKKKKNRKQYKQLLKISETVAYSFVLQPQNFFIAEAYYVQFSLRITLLSHLFISSGSVNSQIIDQKFFVSRTKKFNSDQKIRNLLYRFLNPDRFFSDLFI